MDRCVCVCVCVGGGGGGRNQLVNFFLRGRNWLVGSSLGRRFGRGKKLTVTPGPACFT